MLKIIHNKFFNKPWQYIVFAVMVKAIFFLYFQNLKCPNCFQQGIFYVASGDENNYIEPVENLVHYGEHRVDSGNYSLRMPGYTPVLLFFRLFLNLDWAINLTLFVQIILSGLSCYILGLIALKLFKSKKIFLLTFITYTLSTYVTIWDTYVLTESLATSSMIFCVYLLILAYERQSNALYFFSGLFGTWCFFLRPFILPIIILLAGVILLDKIKASSIKLPILRLLIFISPLIVSESCWVIRNYTISHQLLFTQSRVTYNDEDGPLSKKLDLKWFIGAFSSSFGGDHTFWNPRGTTYWFFNKTPASNSESFPVQIFNDTLSFDELRRVKGQCIAIASDSLDADTKEAYETSIKEKLLQYFNTYRKAHPGHYYITSRLIHLKRFILHSGVYNIPFPPVNKQTLFQKVFKSFYALLYLCVFIIGGAYSILLLIRYYRKPLQAIIILTPLYIILLFPLVFKVHEYRFNTMAYPFLLVLLNCCILKTVSYLKGCSKRKSMS